MDTHSLSSPKFIIHFGSSSCKRKRDGLRLRLLCIGKSKKGEEKRFFDIF
jgi:hypothetical protein